jgi:hypothetical protein
MPWREELTPPAVWEHGNRGQDGAADGIDSRFAGNGSSPRPGPNVPRAWSVDAANPFAQMPTTPESIIVQVRRQLADDASRVMTVEPTVLNQVAERVLRELWESRIKTFVPVLALRQAREILRDQESVISVPCSERRHTEASLALPPLREPRVSDDPSIYDHMTMRDYGDVL